MSLTKMRRKMSKAIQPILYLFVGIFVASCFVWYWPSMGGGRGGVLAQDASNVVARINGVELPRDLYEKAVQMAIRQIELEMRLRNAGKEARIDLQTYHMARGRAFEQLVDGFLKADAAEKEGVKVANREVQAYIDRQVQDEMSTKLDGATAQEKRQFEQQLRQMFNPDNVRRQLAMERLDTQLREKFKPTDADLRLSYNEAKTRHILIKTNPRSDAAARKLAEEILAKVKAGGDFVKLVKQYSDDTNSKNNGGDVGWVGSQSGFVPEFTEAAQRLKKGEVSGLVRTLFGYHILKADDVRSKLPKDIGNPKKKQEYMDSFSEKRIRDKMQSYQTTLRLNAKIEPIDPWIAGYKAENEAISLTQNGGSPAEIQKLTAQAVQSYERASAMPEYASMAALNWKLAELYHSTKQDDKALVAVTRALDGGTSSDLLILKGQIQTGKNLKAEAAKSFQEAEKLIPPEQPWLYLQMQQTYLQIGRKDLATKVYAKWQKYAAAEAQKQKKGGLSMNPKVLQLPTGKK